MSRRVGEAAPTVRMARPAFVLPERVEPPGRALSVAMVAPILALDLGTRTGWALRWDRDHVASGVEAFDLRRQESVGMRILRFRRWLREMLELTQAGLVAYEQPIIHRTRRQANVSVAHNLEGVLLAQLEGRVDYVAPMPSEVKKHATGKGNAPKPLMVAAARARWGKEVQDEDEADALCVLAWVLDFVGEEGP